MTRDRRKDDDLETAGYRVTRFSADQILHYPSDTLARTVRVLQSVANRGDTLAQTARAVPQ